jgi:hypothetical protein
MCTTKKHSGVLHTTPGMWLALVVDRFMLTEQAQELLEAAVKLEPDEFSNALREAVEMNLVDCLVSGFVSPGRDSYRKEFFDAAFVRSVNVKSGP